MKYSIKKMIIVLITICLLSTSFITVNAVSSDSSNYNTLFSVPIGNGSGFIAYTEKLEDCERFGPESFAVLEDKEFYILDSVENEIEIFSKYGQSTKIIKLPSDYGYYDIEVRDNGDMVLLTDNGILVEVYKSGDVKNVSTTVFPLNDEKFNFKFLSLHKNKNGDIVIRNKKDGTEKNIDDNSSKNSFDSVTIKKDGKNFILSENNNNDNYVKYNYQSAGTYPLKYTVNGELLILEREMLKGKKIYIENRISKYKNGKKIGMALAEETKNYEVIPHKYLLATKNGKVYQLVCNSNNVSLLELKISKEEKSNINNDLVKEIIGENIIENPYIIMESTEQERIDAYWAAVDMCEHNWYYNPSTMKTPTTSTTTPPDHLRGTSSIYVDGIPYKWGGFDDIANFTTKISQGKKAGDINTAAVVSTVTGIDCSGFISRAYGLTTKLGTTTMSTQFSNITWNEISIGDIANDPGSHVWMYYDDQYDWYDNWLGCWTYESTVGGYEDRAKDYFRDADECEDYTPMRKD